MSPRRHWRAVFRRFVCIARRNHQAGRLVPSHLAILDHLSSRPLPFEGEPPATQVELVRRNTPDVERRAARILDRALPRHPAQGLMPGLSTVEAMGRHGLAEAIVLAALQPAFFLTDDTIDTTDAVETDPLLLDLVTRNAALLIRTAAGVGRVGPDPSCRAAGTGFLIDETLAVTNRHVALVFAERLRTGFGMRAGRFGTAMKARLVYHGFARRTSHSRA